MSDMSSLSNEYAASADFATEVNAAVLALKRAWSRGQGTTSGQADEEGVVPSNMDFLPANRLSCA